jgi:hypothetical protein
LADQKITELTAWTTPISTDVVPIVDITNTITKKITLADLGILDGWIPASETWAYASATTITVPSGAASKYGKGDKLKLTQTTVKYFYVTSVADTVLTVKGDGAVVVADAAISANYYSHVENPLGFPDWMTFTPSVTGSGGSAGAYAQTVNQARFSVSGKKCTMALDMQITNKGSWSGNINLALPVVTTTGLSYIPYLNLYLQVGSGLAGIGVKATFSIQGGNFVALSSFKTTGADWATHVANNDFIFGTVTYEI